MKEGFELEDVCLVAEVESEVIEQVRDGRITSIGIVSPKSKNEACIPAGLVLVICDKGAEGVLGMTGRRAKSAHFLNFVPKDLVVS